jgi:tetratricopeptide (TPR) repeat protein
MQDLVRSTEARYGAGNARTLKTQIALATALQTSGRIRDSHALTQQLRQAVAAVFAKDEPESLALLAATAHNAGSLGEHALAEAAYRDLVAVAEKNFGPNSTNTNIARNNLAHALMAQQKWDASEAILRPLHTALAADPQRGPDHVETLHVAHSLGNLLARASRRDEALAVIEPLVPACKERLGPAHRITLETMHQLGSLYLDLGRLADAEAVLREATTTARRELKPTNFLTGKLLCELGDSLTRMDRFPEAEPILLEAHAWLARTVGADHGLARTAAANLVALYRRWAKPEQSAAWEGKAGSR